MERMGFRDPEIGSPAHDQLVLWIQKHATEWLTTHSHPPDDRWAETRQELLAHVQSTLREQHKQGENLRELIERQHKRLASDNDSGSYGDWNRTYLEEKNTELAKVETVTRRLEKLDFPEAAPAVAPSYRFELEHLLTAGRGYALGFIDLVATVTYPCYGWNWDTNLPRIKNRTTYRMAAFEAKLSIPSLGELLRQLRFYEEHFGSYRPEFPHGDSLKMPFVVVSSDTRYRTAIEEQGFHFWAVPASLE
jgi:hypothetical protein